MALKTIILSILTSCIITVQNVDADTLYSNEWIVKTNMSETDLSEIAYRYGFRLARKLIDDQVLLIHNRTPKSSRQRDRMITKRLLHNNMIKSAEQLKWNNRSLRASPFVVQDAQWSNMWYIVMEYLVYFSPGQMISPNMNFPCSIYFLSVNNKQNRHSKPSMKILEAWKDGYTGSGITIAIVDDGVDFNHRDLKSNYVSYLSEDFYDDDKSPLPANADRHGTKCAGIALAEKNTICVVGVAFKSRLVVYRMIGPLGATQGGEVSSLSKLNGIDIFSNSWGGEDRTKFDGPSDSVAQALQYGSTHGRNGKGAIYVFAGGNGGYDDNCNCDGYVNSVYTIAINSISVDAKPPGYAERCSAILASTFSGPGGTASSDNIRTTDVGGGCIDSFTGTSASTPMAAGIFSLLLQANHNLTWRDVQELVVRTSNNNGLQYGEFKQNGVGRNVSDWFGYGIIDTQALIRAGKSWTTLPEQHICRHPIKHENARARFADRDFPRYTEHQTLLPKPNRVFDGYDPSFEWVSGAPIGVVTGTCRMARFNYYRSIKANTKPRTTRGKTDTDGCNQTATCVNSLEHVGVNVTFRSSLRGAVALKLTSPRGTVSELLSERSDDTTKAKQTWTYMSVQYWGENPTGEWTLTMAIASDWRQSGSLESWQLVLYGSGVGCTKQKPKGQTTTTTKQTGIITTGTSISITTGGSSQKPAKGLSTPYIVAIGITSAGVVVASIIGAVIIFRFIIKRKGEATVDKINKMAESTEHHM